MKRKNEFLKFLTWLRNGTTFCITWFLILILIFNTIYDIPSISTNKLIELIFLCMGAVFLFNTFFTCLFIPKWSFTKRLSGFMIGISIYECLIFYSLGIFKNESITVWIIFLSHFNISAIQQKKGRTLDKIITGISRKKKKGKSSSSGIS